MNGRKWQMADGKWQMANGKWPRLATLFPPLVREISFVRLRIGVWAHSYRVGAKTSYCTNAGYCSHRSAGPDSPISQSMSPGSATLFRA